MKIVRVRVWRPERLNPTFNQSDWVVTVETDAGITGIGEGGSPDTLAQCAGMLIGEDPLRIEHHWQRMYRGFFYPAGREKLHALGALDLALWDIRGKSLDAPVYALLGGAVRDHVECYATGYPWQGSLTETARACVAAGFRAFRTAVGDTPDGVFDARRIVDRTVDACRQIREGVGPDGDWCIDFHTRLDLADAIRLCRLLESLNPLFVEDPLRSENPEALTALRPQVTSPIAVGEQFGDRWDIHTLIERHVIDHTRVTLPNVGGITELRKIAALCETHYVGMVPHFTGPVALAANVHTLLAFPGPALQEVTGAGVTLPPHLSAGPEFADGKLWPVDRPGLGVEFVESRATLTAEVTERAVPIPLYRRPDGSLTNW